MHGKLIRVISFYELLLSASASRRGDYTIMVFGPLLVIHVTMTRRFSHFVLKDIPPQRHSSSRRPCKLRSRACSAGVAGTQHDEQLHLLQ
ncbi:hypothetical protein Y032_0021g284 [Ancylostoma ceylanicum]|uniref:Uncharacterized protein n=1 Tax=Ancylostoma ceylanicum TaxID=53326 RepID=A0A016V0R3_9BILA|nr:hypothetical protein Y032_0021g284 [Ancylostoma ceylanicum]